MLAIGSDNVAKTFKEWSADLELQQKFPNFRKYLNTVYFSANKASTIVLGLSTALATLLSL